MFISKMTLKKDSHRKNKFWHIFDNEYAIELLSCSDIPNRIIKSLLLNYGSAVFKLTEFLSPHDLAAQLGENYIKAQVAYSINCEKAQRISDVMLRRTVMGKRDGFGLDSLDEVANLMARELNWTPRKTELEKHRYVREINNNNYRLVT